MQIERHCLKMSKVAERWVSLLAWFPILSSSPVWHFPESELAGWHKGCSPFCASVLPPPWPALLPVCWPLLCPLLPLSKSRWKMRMLSYCKSKRNIIHKGKNRCSTFISHPFHNPIVYFQKSHSCFNLEIPFFFCRWTLSAPLLLVWRGSGDGVVFVSCCMWHSCPCSYWGCRVIFCSLLWNPMGSTRIAPWLLKALF